MAFDFVRSAARLQRTICTLAAASLIAAAAPAFAQDQGAPVAPTPAPAEGEDGMGQPYLLELSGDWQIICVRTELEHDPCSMGQDLLDPGGSQVAQLRIIGLAPGGTSAAAINISTPLATLLSRDVTLSVDGGPPRAYGYTYCTEAFCLSSFGLTEEQVNEFRRGSTAEWTIYSIQAPDRPVSLQSSLSGFTAGFQRVSELNALNAQAARAAQANQQ